MFLIYFFVFLNSLLIKATEKFLYIAFQGKIPQHMPFFIKTIENTRKNCIFRLLSDFLQKNWLGISDKDFLKEK